MAEGPKIAVVGGKHVLNTSYGNIEAVEAPSPKDKTKTVKLEFSRDLITSIAQAGWKTEAMEYWSLIRGKLPPVNCIGHHEQDQEECQLIGIKDAHALFRSIERPCNSFDMGEDVYVYVVNPSYTYEHILHMVCVARRVPLKDNELLTVYVRFHEVQDQIPEDAPKGEIIGWDLVRSSENDKLLPVGFETRYEEKVW